MATLTLAEMETHLNLVGDDRNTWHVYSDDPVMMRRLETIGATVTKTEKSGGKHYTLPANQVTLRKPSKPLSAERKAQQAANLSQARAALSINSAK